MSYHARCGKQQTSISTSDPRVSSGVRLGLPAIFATGPLLLRKRTCTRHRHRSQKCRLCFKTILRIRVRNRPAFGASARRRSGIFRPMNELVERNLVPLVHRLLADYASRKLLSPLGSRECVTEYIAPQWGQKKVPPSGTGPVRGMLVPPYSDQYAPQRK